MRIDIAFFSIAFRIGVGLVLGIATGIALSFTLLEISLWLAT